MSKRSVVFGSSGQLGVELVRELNERGYTVQGFERKAIDITDTESVSITLAAQHPDIVFNCAAYNQVDVAEREPQPAFQANALGVRNLALACRELNAQLVHYSTDYVFDGSAGRPYTEEDPTHPLGAYAVSKLAGELYARAYLEAPLIIRTCGVFGPGGLRTARGNFVEVMLRLAGGGQPIRVVKDLVASPTYAPVLAARTIDLVERNCCGIFHVGGGAPISWFDYAKLIFEKAGLTPDLRATTQNEFKTAAMRPRYSALSNARLESEGVAPFPPLAWAVENYLAIRRGMTA